jgi:hypothetical protein
MQGKAERTMRLRSSAQSKPLSLPLYYLVVSHLSLSYLSSLFARRRMGDYAAIFAPQPVEDVRDAAGRTGSPPAWRGCGLPTLLRKAESFFNQTCAVHRRPDYSGR